MVVLPTPSNPHMRIDDCLFLNRLRKRDESLLPMMIFIICIYIYLLLVVVCCLLLVDGCLAMWLLIVFVVGWLMLVVVLLEIEKLCDWRDILVRGFIVFCHPKKILPGCTAPDN